MAAGIQTASYLPSHGNLIFLLSSLKIANSVYCWRLLKVNRRYERNQKQGAYMAAGVDLNPVFNPKQYNFGKVSDVKFNEDGKTVSVTYSSFSVDTLSQKINKFINSSTNNLYNVWRHTTDTLSLVNELYPREALGKTIQWLKAGSAPFILTYQVHTINEVMSLDKSGNNQETWKAWLDLVDATLVSWGAVASAVDVPKRWAFASEKTFLGLGTAALDAKMQGEKFFEQQSLVSKSVSPINLKAATSEKNLALFRLCAAIISLATAAIGVAALISGSAVVSTPILLTMAVSTISFKLTAAFYDQVREYQKGAIVSA